MQLKIENEFEISHDQIFVIRHKINIILIVSFYRTYIHNIFLCPFKHVFYQKIFKKLKYLLNKMTSL